jgi:hypothetical protein
MVDHAAKYIMILEVKSLFVQKAMTNNSFVLTCSTDNPLGDPNFVKVKRYVVGTVKKCSKKKLKINCQGNNVMHRLEMSFRDLH